MRLFYRPVFKAYFLCSTVCVIIMSDVFKKHSLISHIWREVRTSHVVWAMIPAQYASVRHSGSDPSNLFTATQRADGSHRNGCFQLLLPRLALREKTRRYTHKLTLKRWARRWAAGWAVGKCQDHMIRRSFAKGHNREEHRNAGSPVERGGGQLL